MKEKARKVIRLLVLHALPLFLVLATFGLATDAFIRVTHELLIRGGITPDTFVLFCAIVLIPFTLVLCTTLLIVNCADWSVD